MKLDFFLKMIFITALTLVTAKVNAEIKDPASCETLLRDFFTTQLQTPTLTSEADAEAIRVALKESGFADDFIAKFDVGERLSSLFQTRIAHKIIYEEFLEQGVRRRTDLRDAILNFKYITKVEDKIDFVEAIYDRLNDILGQEIVSSNMTEVGAVARKYGFRRPDKFMELIHAWRSYGHPSLIKLAIATKFTEPEVLSKQVTRQMPWWAFFISSSSSPKLAFPQLTPRDLTAPVMKLALNEALERSQTSLEEYFKSAPRSMRNLFLRKYAWALNENEIKNILSQIHEHRVYPRLADFLKQRHMRFLKIQKLTADKKALQDKIIEAEKPTSAEKRIRLRLASASADPYQVLIDNAIAEAKRLIERPNYEHSELLREELLEGVWGPSIRQQLEVAQEKKVRGIVSVYVQLFETFRKGRKGYSEVEFMSIIESIFDIIEASTKLSALSASDQPHLYMNPKYIKDFFDVIYSLSPYSKFSISQASLDYISDNIIAFSKWNEDLLREFVKEKHRFQVVDRAESPESGENKDIIKEALLKQKEALQKIQQEKEENLNKIRSELQTIDEQIHEIVALADAEAQVFLHPPQEQRNEKHEVTKPQTVSMPEDPHARRLHERLVGSPQPQENTRPTKSILIETVVKPHTQH